MAEDRGAREMERVKVDVQRAATLLGKSPRTVRHMAKNGQIPAQRDGHRWLFDTDALRNLPGANQGVEDQVAAIRGSVEATLDKISPPPRRGAYSLRDLRVYRASDDILRGILAIPHGRVDLDRAEAALIDFRQALACAHHQFHPDLKLEHECSTAGKRPRPCRTPARLSPPNPGVPHEPLPCVAGRRLEQRRAQVPRLLSEQERALEPQRQHRFSARVLSSPPKTLHRQNACGPRSARACFEGPRAAGPRSPLP